MMQMNLTRIDPKQSFIFPKLNMREHHPSGIGMQEGIVVYMIEN